MVGLRGLSAAGPILHSLQPNELSSREMIVQPLDLVKRLFIECSAPNRRQLFVED
jgi:hypothetical protein